jgi:hypothetical protein
MKQIPLLGAAFAAVAAMAVMSVPAAATPTWTASGSCDDPGCSASAVITLVSGSFVAPTNPPGNNGSAEFEIQLTDNLVNPPSQGDLVSGILLSLNESFKSASLVSQSGELIDVTGNNNGYAIDPSSPDPTHWGAGKTTQNCSGASSCIAVETAGDSAAGGTPVDMIIGQPNASGNYSNANSGGMTNGHFAPFILGTGIFFVDVMGLSGNLPPSISGVTIAFGTGPDYFKTAVPEPSSIAMLLAGLGLIGGALYFARKKSSPSGQ